MMSIPYDESLCISRYGKTYFATLQTRIALGLFRDLVSDDATDHRAPNHAHGGAGTGGGSDSGAEQSASGQAEQHCCSCRIH